MSTNNDVFQILVTSGNEAVLPVDQTIDTLAVGQIGVFDEETKLSLDGSAVVRNFFIAVGLDRDGDAAMDDINTSAGQLIQRKNMRFYSYRPHTAGQPMITELVGFKADCDTDYSYKIEFRNQEIYRRQGFSQFSKTFSVRTSCCDDCATDCPTGDCQELGNLLVDNMNDDKDGLVLAELFVNQGSLTITAEPTADADATVTVDGEAIVVALLDADLIPGVADKIAAAFAASTKTLAISDGVDTVTFTSLTTISTPTGTVVYGPGTTGTTATVVDFVSVVVTNVELAALPAVCPGVRTTTVPLAINTFCEVPLKYYHPRQTIIITSLVEGFGCNGTVNITQDAAMEEGNGRDVQQKEYHAGGWNGKPGVYRLSTATGTANPGFEYFADKTVEYDQFSLTYDQFSVAGWLEHLNNLNTCIAVPAVDTVTRDSLVIVLDGLLTPLGFDPLADDVALANVDPLVVESTEDIDDPNKDGLA